MKKLILPTLVILIGVQTGVEHSLKKPMLAKDIRQTRSIASLIEEIGEKPDIFELDPSRFNSSRELEVDWVSKHCQDPSLIANVKEFESMRGKLRVGAENLERWMAEHTRLLSHNLVATMQPAKGDTNVAETPIRTVQALTPNEKTKPSGPLRCLNEKKGVEIALCLEADMRAADVELFADSSVKPIEDSVRQLFAISGFERFRLMLRDREEIFQKMALKKRDDLTREAALADMEASINASRDSLLVELKEFGERLDKNSAVTPQQAVLLKGAAAQSLQDFFVAQTVRGLGRISAHFANLCVSKAEAKKSNYPITLKISAVSASGWMGVHETFPFKSVTACESFGNRIREEEFTLNRVERKRGESAVNWECQRPEAAE